VERSDAAGSARRARTRAAPALRAVRRSARHPRYRAGFTRVRASGLACAREDLRRELLDAALERAPSSSARGSRSSSWKTGAARGVFVRTTEGTLEPAALQSRRRRRYRSVVARKLGLTKPAHGRGRTRLVDTISASGASTRGRDVRRRRRLFFAQPRFQNFVPMSWSWYRSNVCRNGREMSIPASGRPRPRSHTACARFEGVTAARRTRLDRSAGPQCTVRRGRSALLIGRCGGFVDPFHRDKGSFSR